VTTLPLTSSNSTKPGQRSDSVVNNAVPVSITPARNCESGLERQRRDEYWSTACTATVISVLLALL